ncbi:Lrp/AsnC family transcriptional regulator [Stappia stellulata]|uniref:Lrp/AsnC family transcriptional regulator n=1 Tax=Stappia stellulata TaxID=71235 RepID=UPI00041AFFE4|nr:Lrp/AsnC family transcriptional regulator [Stappia stellulata]
MKDAEVSDRPLSELDRKLVQLLTQDARRSNTELAGLLDVSRMTVKNRIDGLVRRGVIERFTIKLADERGGREPAEAAFFHMKLKRPFCKHIHDAVQGWPELIGAWSIAGSTDMTLLVQAAGFDRLDDLRDLLARHPDVETVWTAMILRQWAHKSSLNPDYDPRRPPDRLDRRLGEIAAEQGADRMTDEGAAPR